MAASFARALIGLSVALAVVACGERSPKAPASASPPAAPAPAPTAVPAVRGELREEPIAGDSDAVCKAVEGADFPAGDLPSSEDKAKLKSGDAVRFYYGIGTPADDVRARHAAFLERDQGDELVLGGSAILMMLYANGRGVQRNLSLAIKLACAVGEAPAEIEGRVAHLNSMKSSPGKQPFDFCDDVTSGFMMGHCRALEEERQKAVRQRALDGLVGGWPAADRKAFDALMHAFDAFVQARTGNEVDLSGTDRAAALIDAEAGMKQAFLERLKDAERGTLPALGPADHAAADAELNRVYAQALRSDLSGSTVTAAGIKATEKAWIRYRDAWVAFGAQRYPRLPAEAWKALLTRERIEQLRAF
jgi:uncharacterized protein YecT (DUF1311 family)